MVQNNIVNNFYDSSMNAIKNNNIGMQIQNNQPKMGFGQYLQNFQNNHPPLDPNCCYKNLAQPFPATAQQTHLHPQFPIPHSYSMIDDPFF
jgi:hypothetical protein